MDIGPDTIVRMAELQIDPERIAAYTAFLTQEIAASVDREPGVLMLHALTVKGDPSRLRILEVYASQTAYEAHLRTPHFLAYKAQTADMVLSLDLVELDHLLLRAK